MDCEKDELFGGRKLLPGSFFCCGRGGAGGGQIVDLDGLIAEDGEAVSGGGEGEVLSGADHGCGIADEDEAAGIGIKDADELALDIVDIGLGEGDEWLVGHEGSEGETAPCGGVGGGVPEVASLPPLLPEFFAVQVDGGHEVIGTVAGATGEDDVSAEGQERGVAVALKGEDVFGGQPSGEVGAVREALELNFSNEPEIAAAFLRLGGEQFEEAVAQDGEIERVQGLRAEEGLEAGGLVDGKIDVLGLLEEPALEVYFWDERGGIGGDVGLNGQVGAVWRDADEGEWVRGLQERLEGERAVGLVEGIADAEEEFAVAERPEITLAIEHGPLGLPEEFSGGDVEEVGADDLGLHGVVLAGGLAMGGIALDEGVDAEGEEKVIGVNEIEGEGGLPQSEIEHAGRLKAERRKGNGSGGMELRRRGCLVGCGQGREWKGEHEERGGSQEGGSRQPRRGEHAPILRRRGLRLQSWNGQVRGEMKKSGLWAGL